MQIGDKVTATFLDNSRKPYTGKLVRLSENIAEIQGAPFEVRPFSRKLWTITPVSELVLVCNCDIPNQVQCDYHGPRE